MKRNALFVVGAALAALAWLFVSRSERGAPPKPVEADGGGDAEVAVPMWVLARVVAPEPEASWRRVQAHVGGVLAILPSTLGGMVGSLAELPPGFEGAIDGKSALVGALVRRPDRSVGWSFAVRASDPVRLERALHSDAGSRGRPGAPIFKEVEPDGVFVFGSSRADVACARSYLVGVLGARVRPSGDVSLLIPGRPLAEAGRPAIERAWSGARAELAAADERARAAHGGRAPDYADATVILEGLDAFVQRSLAALGDLDHVDALVSLDELGVRVRVEAVPSSAEGPAHRLLASMAKGTQEPLARASGRAAAVAVFHHGAVENTDEPLELWARRALGSRLRAEEVPVLLSAGESWRRARGGWTSAGLFFPERGLVVETPAGDPAAAELAMRRLIRLSELSPFRARGAADGGVPLIAKGASSIREERVGDVTTWKGAEDWEAAWWVRQDVLRAALGPKGRSESLLAGDDPLLQRTPTLGPWLERVPAFDTLLVLFPSRFRDLPSPDHEPALAAFGAGEGRAWLEARITSRGVRGLVEGWSGLGR